MVGNGSHIHCQGYCPDAPLQIYDTTFTNLFFVLAAVRANVILGLQWLGSLGPLTADFSIPQITFTHHDKSITLTGEPLTTPASSSNLHHLLLKQVVSSLHTLTFQSIILPNPTPLTDPNIQCLIQEFSHLVKTTSTLPPPRAHDHHIPLIPSAPPVNIRPYRFPHYQKQIMTRLISDMLRGLIKPSTSPYSSPVLLVQKRTALGDFVLIRGH